MRFSRAGKIFASGVISAGAVFVTALPAMAATTIGASIIVPSTASTFNATSWGNISGSSTPTGPATLTATANVLNIRDTTANTYWNGTAFVAGSTTVVATTTIGTGAWSYTALTAAKLTSGHSYSIVDKVTDTAGNNTTTSATTFGYQTTKPTVTITTPTSGKVYSATSPSAWPGTISGTAAATLPATLPSTANALTIQDTTASPNTYWTGSAWSTNVTTVTATGTTSWSYALSGTNLTAGHSYSVTDKVTDSATNSTTSSATTFGYQTTAPAVAITYPVANTTYGSNWTGSFSGTSSASSPAVLAAGSNVLTIQDTTASPNTYWNGTQFVSTPSTVAATGTTSWSYSFIRTNFVSSHTYTVTDTVTDSAYNTATTSTTFTYTPVTNSAAINAPVNGSTWAVGHAPSQVLGTLTFTNQSCFAITLQNTSNATQWNGTSWVASTGSTSRLYVPVLSGGTNSWNATNPGSYASWSFNLPFLAAGSYSFQTWAYNYGSGCLSAATPQSSLPTMIPSTNPTYSINVSLPVTTIADPTDGTVYESTTWVGIDGTSIGGDANTSLSTLTYSIQNTTTGLYWDGTDWVASDPGLSLDLSANWLDCPLNADTTRTCSWSLPLSSDELVSGDSYSITAATIDSWGNTSNADTSSWQYEIPPVTAIDYPVDGSVYGPNWSGTISGTAAAFGDNSLTDDQLTIHDTTTGLYWDGVEWTILPTTIDVPAGSTWSYNIDSSAFTDGDTYQVTNAVVDTLGFTSTPAMSTFTFITSPPVTTITFPWDGETYGQNWPGYLSGTSSVNPLTTLASNTLTLYDSTAGLYWDGTEWTADPSTFSVSPSFNWSISFPTINLTLGDDYELTSVVTDALANVSTPATSNFTYDILYPSTTITSPTDGTTYNAINWPGLLSGTSQSGATRFLTPADAQWTLFDNNTGMYWDDDNQIWVDADPQNDYVFADLSLCDVLGDHSTLCSWSVPFDPSNLSSHDSYTLTVITYDSADNPSPPATVGFTYISDPPTTTITTPVDGQAYGWNYPGTITGTSEAYNGATVALNTLTIEDTTANGGAGLWWNGTSWQDTDVTVQASGYESWSYALSYSDLCQATASTPCPGSGDSFRVTNVATDSIGLVSTEATSTFAFSTVPPTIAITSYQNSTRYGQSNWPGGASGYISGPLTAGTTLLEPNAVQIEIVRKNLSYQGTQYNDYWNPGGTGCDPSVGSQVAGDYPASPTSCWTASPAYTPTTWSSTTNPNWGPPDESPQLHPTLSSCLNYGTSTPRSCTWSYYFPSSWMQNGVTYTSRVIGVDTGGNAANAVKCWTFWNYGPGVSPSTVTALTPSHLTFTGTASEQVACYVACSYNSTPPPPYTWITSSITGVQVTIKDVTANKYWNGALWQTNPASVSASTSNSWANWTYTLPSGANYLVNGHQYQLSAISTDSSGNETTYPFYDSTGQVTETQPITSFTYGSSPPQAAITSPTNNSTVGTNYTGWIGGTSTGSGSMKITQTMVTIKDTTTNLYWNGTSWQFGAVSLTATATGSSGTVPSVTTWRYYGLGASALTSGRTYAVSAVTTDAGTNTSSASQTSFRYYKTAPTSAVTYPSPISYGANWSGTLRGTVSVAAGAPAVGLVTLQIRDTTTSQYWNGSGWQVNPTTVAPTGTTSWTYSLAAGALTSGHIYWIIVNATDAVGNSSSSTPSNFTYNTTAPTVNIQGPINGTTYGNNWGGSVHGTTQANGTLNVLSNKVVIQDTTTNQYWNGSSWVSSYTQLSATGTTTWSYALSASKLTTGHNYSTVVSATDSGQNTGTSSTVTFSYDSVPPSIAVLYPVSGVSYNHTTWAGYISGSAVAHGNKTIAVVKATLIDETTHQYWNGTSWQSTAATIPATVNFANNTWSAPVASSNLTVGHNYLTNAVAIDSGNIDPGSANVAFKYVAG